MTKTKLIIYESLPCEPILYCNNIYVVRKIESINDRARRTSSIIAYNMLDEMLRKHTNTTLDAYEISENEYGKPYFINCNLYFNISHSNNAVMCALSEHPIGIDVEFIGDKKPLILKKCFGDCEAGQISNDADFYSLWTLKEAYAKAVGIGISRRLSSINFKLGDNIICRDNSVYVKNKFYTDKAYGYAYSICSEDEISDIEVKKV